MGIISWREEKNVFKAQKAMFVSTVGKVRTGRVENIGMKGIKIWEKSK